MSIILINLYFKLPSFLALDKHDYRKCCHWYLLGMLLEAISCTCDCMWWGDRHKVILFSHLLWVIVHPWAPTDVSVFCFYFGAFSLPFSTTSRHLKLVWWLLLSTSLAFSAANQYTNVTLEWDQAYLPRFLPSSFANASLLLMSGILDTSAFKKSHSLSLSMQCLLRKKKYHN